MSETSGGSDAARARQTKPTQLESTDRPAARLPPARRHDAPPSDLRVASRREHGARGTVVGAAAVDGGDHAPFARPGRERPHVAGGTARATTRRAARTRCSGRSDAEEAVCARGWVERSSERQREGLGETMIEVVAGHYPPVTMPPFGHTSGRERGLTRGAGRQATRGAPRARRAPGLARGSRRRRRQ